MLEQLADHDDELARAIADGRDARRREKVLQDLARETGENLGVSVLFGSRDQLVGRSPPAEGAAPRGARTASGRRPPRRLRPRAVRLQGHRTDRSAGSRSPGCSAERSREGSDLKTGDGDHARARRRCSRSRARRPRRSARPSDGDVVAVAKVDAVKAGQWLGVGQAPAAGRDRPIRRAIARSRSSPPTARTTSSCPARLQRLTEEDAGAHRRA